MSSSIFNTGAAPVLTNEQKQLRRIAWKPSKVRQEMHKSSPVITVYRSAAAQAEYDAAQAAKKPVKEVSLVDRALRQVRAAKRAAKKAAA